MMVNTNITDEIMRNLMRVNTQALATRMERMSSGLRVNRAGDDPSGLAISKGMQSQLRGLTTGIQNMQDGISVVQTMDGGLEVVHNILLRIRDLATRAANEAPMTAADRKKADDECAALVREVDREARAVTFNTKRILQGGSEAAGISWFSDNGGTYSMYMTSGTGTTPIPLTNDPSSNVNPKWSPDESKVLFSTNRDGNYELYVQNADGSNVKRLTNSAGDDLRGVWSPDGTKVAYQAAGDHIIVMNADGSNAMDLTAAGEQNIFPLWSPDGSRLSYVSTTGVFVINADGTGRTLVSTPVTPRWDQGAQWSPDGSKVAFSLNGDIYAANTDGSGMAQLTNTADQDIYPFWSPDGSEISFTRQMGNDEIFVMNADGTNARDITNNPARELQGATGNPWSDDGGQITFSRDAGGGLEVFGANADGTGAAQLTTTPGDNYFTDWAPPYRVQAVQAGPDNEAEDRFSMTFPKVTAKVLGIRGASLRTVEGARAALDAAGQALDAVAVERQQLGELQNRMKHATNDSTAQFMGISGANSRIVDADFAWEITGMTRDMIVAKSGQAMASQAFSEVYVVARLIGINLK